MAAGLSLSEKVNRSQGNIRNHRNQNQKRDFHVAFLSICHASSRRHLIRYFILLILTQKGANIPSECSRTFVGRAPDFYSIS